MSPLLTIKKTYEDKHVYKYSVIVKEDNIETEHEVSIEKDYYEKLTSKKSSPDQLVKFSFHFLLEREPKESILKKFNLNEIQKYFPGYESEVIRHLSE